MYHLQHFSSFSLKLIFLIVVCSYAEVRAEQRRELGIEESNPEVTVDKVRSYF